MDMFLSMYHRETLGAKTRIKSNARKNRTQKTYRIIHENYAVINPRDTGFIFLCYSVNTTSSNCEEKRLFRIDNFPLFNLQPFASAEKTRGGWFFKSLRAEVFSLASVLSPWSARRKFWRLVFNKTVSKSIILIYGVLFFCFVFCLSGCFICLCLLPALAQIFRLSSIKNTRSYFSKY